jgi:hypothetical protein
MNSPNFTGRLDDAIMYIGYASDTIENGNISEAIRYLSMLYSIAPINYVVRELELIKERFPNKYEFIISKIRECK